MDIFSNLIDRYKNGNLIIQIIIGLILGALLGFFANKENISILSNLNEIASVLGGLFVGALKALAPILVFILVVSSITVQEFDSVTSSNLKKVIFYYILATLSAALVATTASFIFPVELKLQGIQAVTENSTNSISQVLKILLFKMIDNPINAISTGNYIGILTWSIASAIALRQASDNTKEMFNDFSQAITKMVKFIIKLAPFGIFGLVSQSVSEVGGEALIGYAKLLALLVGCMAFVALIVNPLIAFIVIKKNPYPLVFTCLKESGITAFFTRSSAANIPVNLNLCKNLGLDPKLYSISIPLGSTINMGGAAVTISVLALAAVNSIGGIEVSFLSAFLLSILAAIAACGASGIAGGSLLLVPLACSFFGISNDITLQVVAIGFIVSVVQDSVETALNSSSDVLFTTIASSKDKK